MQKPLTESHEESWLEGWKLTTFKEGFGVGAFLALILQLGIINITVSTLKFFVFVFLLVGILVSVNQAIRRKSLISPAWDGFVSGFCTVIGIIDLLLPQLSIFP